MNFAKMISKNSFLKQTLALKTQDKVMKMEELEKAADLEAEFIKQSSFASSNSIYI